MTTTFNITAPDGTAYQVQGPDGATEQQALAQVQAQHAPQTNGGILRNLAAGAEGAISSIPGTIVNALNPIPHITDFLNPGGSGSPQALKAATAPGDTVSGALDTGASKIGFPTPETTSANTFPERLARGTGAGLAGGAVMPTAGLTVGKILANMAMGATSGAGAVTGGEIANQTGHPGLAPLAAVAGGIVAPMGAVGAVNGVRTGLGAARTALTGGIPEPSVNGAVTDAINELGNMNAPASEDMLGRLQAAQTAAQKEASANFKAAGIDENTTPLPKAELKSRVSDYLSGLTTADRAAIPPKVLSTLDQIPDDAATIREIQSWRSQIGGAGRQAFRAGNSNDGRVIGGLEGLVGNFLDELPGTSSGMSPEQLTAYNQARAQWAQMKQTFAQPVSPVTKALSPNDFGTAATSNTADLFIKPNTSAGAPEAFASYMKAIGSDPAGQQAARDAFSQKFLDYVQTTGTDEAGNPQISPAKISKFLDQYDHVTGSDIFSPDQKRVIDALDNMATQANRNTGRSILNAALRRAAVPTVGAGIGGTVGGIPGALAGAAAGEGVNRIMTAINNSSRDQAVRLLASTLSNPSMATALLKPATSAGSMSLPLQARIYGALLGKTANDNATRQVNQ